MTRVSEVFTITRPAPTRGGTSMSEESLASQASLPSASNTWILPLSVPTAMWEPSAPTPAVTLPSVFARQTTSPV